MGRAFSSAKEGPEKSFWHDSPKAYLPKAWRPEAAEAGSVVGGYGHGGRISAPAPRRKGRYLTPEELGDILRSEAAKWGPVIRRANIRAG